MSVDSSLPDDVLGLILQLAVRNSGIKCFQFATLEFSPAVEERADFAEADSLVAARARNLRESLRLPFWDGAMLAAIELAVVPSGILKAAAFHQELSGKTVEVLAKDVRSDVLNGMANMATASNRLLAITSHVEMDDGSIRHIPLLDLHIECSGHATALLIEMIPLLNVAGTLVISGNSYHFYGDELLTPDALTVFLGRALHFAPIVDRKWIGHQLMEGRCALRISPRTLNDQPPAVVCRID